MLGLYVTHGGRAVLRGVSRSNQWSGGFAGLAGVASSLPPQTCLAADHHPPAHQSQSQSQSQSQQHQRTPTPPTQPAKTFHKRQLPDSLVSMSSSAGKELFREALALRGMESFFPLSEQFVTQSEPSFCALSSLAMVLNALNHDPGKAWKGPWRWISEETLQCETEAICGHSLERVKRNGMDFGEFASLAQCHGVRIRSYRSDPAVGGIDIADNDVKPGYSHSTSLQHFRETIAAITQSPSADAFLVVNFSRKALGQTGDGHFSPVGGYHPGKDLVLVLDVARFKYPPFWVPLPALWESMRCRDEITGRSRGFFVINSSTEGVNATANNKAESAGAGGVHVHGPSCGHAH